MTPSGRQPQTLPQKLIARASGRSRVVPGEIVSCQVDLAMFHDSSGPRRRAIPGPSSDQGRHSRGVGNLKVLVIPADAGIHRCCRC